MTPSGFCGVSCKGRSVQTAVNGGCLCCFYVSVSNVERVRSDAATSKQFSYGPKSQRVFCGVQSRRDMRAHHFGFHEAGRLVPSDEIEVLS
jgi:hypothetical protein